MSLPHIQARLINTKVHLRELEESLSILSGFVGVPPPPGSGKLVKDTESFDFGMIPALITQAADLADHASRLVEDMRNLSKHIAGDELNSAPTNIAGPDRG